MAVLFVFVQVRFRNQTLRHRLLCHSRHFFCGYARFTFVDTVSESEYRWVVQNSDVIGKVIRWVELFLLRELRCRTHGKKGFLSS